MNGIERERLLNVTEETIDNIEALQTVIDIVSSKSDRLPLSDEDITTIEVLKNIEYGLQNKLSIYRKLITAYSITT